MSAGSPGENVRIEVVDDQPSDTLPAGTIFRTLGLHVNQTEMQKRSVALAVPLISLLAIAAPEAAQTFAGRTDRPTGGKQCIFWAAYSPFSQVRRSL